MKEQSTITHGSDNSTGKLITYGLPVAIGLGVAYWAYITIQAAKADKEAVQKENEALKVEIEKLKASEKEKEKRIEEMLAKYTGIEVKIETLEKQSQEKTEIYEQKLTRLVDDLSKSAVENLLINAAFENYKLTNPHAQTLSQKLQEEIAVIKNQNQQKINQYEQENIELKNIRDKYFNLYLDLEKKFVEHTDKYEILYNQKDNIAKRYEQLSQAFDEYKLSTQASTQTLELKITDLTQANGNLATQLKTQEEAHRKALNQLGQENLTPKNITPVFAGTSGSNNTNKLTDNPALRRECIHQNSVSLPLIVQELSKAYKEIPLVGQENDDQLLIKLLIFLRMDIENDDKTDEQIILEAKQILFQYNISENLSDKFPKSVEIFYKFEKKDGVLLSKVSLTKDQQIEKYKNLRKLFLDGKEVPKDITAHNVFSTRHDQEKAPGRKLSMVVKKEDYIKRFGGKIQPDSSSGNRASRTSSFSIHSS